MVPSLTSTAACLDPERFTSISTSLKQKVLLKGVLTNFGPFPGLWISVRRLRTFRVRLELHARAVQMLG